MRRRKSWSNPNDPDGRDIGFFINSFSGFQTKGGQIWKPFSRYLDKREVNRQNSFQGFKTKGDQTEKTDLRDFRQKGSKPTNSFSVFLYKRGADSENDSDRRETDHILIEIPLCQQMTKSNTTHSNKEVTFYQ